MQSTVWWWLKEPSTRVKNSTNQITLKPFPNLGVENVMNFSYNYKQLVPAM